MRIVKEAEERRNEILNVAEELFTQKGYENTTTGDILDQIGIARGTLYYHFKSKEDIMDELIERYGVRVLSAAREMAADHSIPVPERMLRTIMALNISESQGGKEIIHQLHKPNNVLMHHKVQKLLLTSVPPILATIVRDGIKQGIYDTPYPDECMEMVLAYINTVLDNGTLSMTEEVRASRIQALIFHIDRMLGAKSGTHLKIMEVFDYGTSHESIQ